MLLLLSLFSCVRLCANPQMAAHQAPLSLGFSRQEHWSGLPFPSPMQESEKWKWSHSVVSNSWQPHGLQPTRLLCPWDFPGKSTGVGCHCLPQIHRYYQLMETLHHIPGGGHGNPLQYPLLGESPWTEEPCGLQSMGLQRVGHNWATNTLTFTLSLHHILLKSCCN